MKKVLVILLLVISSVSITTSAKAQVSISVNINSQPAWGPAGYDYAAYYYLPDIDIYYNVPLHRFYYLSGGKWIYSQTLPARYSNYDLYSAHKVVLKDKNVFTHYSEHVKQYARFKNQHDQQPIRDSKEAKYGNNKNNWQNNRFSSTPVKQQPASRQQQGGNHHAEANQGKNDGRQTHR